MPPVRRTPRPTHKCYSSAHSPTGVWTKQKRNTATTRPAGVQILCFEQLSVDHSADNESGSATAEGMIHLSDHNNTRNDVSGAMIHSNVLATKSDTCIVFPDLHAIVNIRTSNVERVHTHLATGFKYFIGTPTAQVYDVPPRRLISSSRVTAKMSSMCSPISR